jgi:hypothetical protein
MSPFAVLYVVYVGCSVWGIKYMDRMNGQLSD